MQIDTAQHRPLLALLIRLGAISALATMGALIKLAGSRGVHLVELLFWRQFLTIPILLGWIMMATGNLSDLATNRRKDHAKRGVYGMIGMVLNFGGVLLLPLAEASTMNFTTPIWAVILTTLLLKDRPGIWRWSAVILGFVGVLLIAQPGSGTIPLYGAAVALGGAFMVALISIQIADLGRTDKPITIVFWFATISAPIFALCLPFLDALNSLQQWPLMLAIGIAGTIGQLLLSASLRFGKVASVIVMDYSALFWATIYGYALFSVFPASSTWIGAPLIVAAGVVITWREHRDGRNARRAAAEQGGT